MKKCNLFLKYIYAFLLVMSSIKVTCRYFVFVNVNLCVLCVCVGWVVHGGGVGDMSMHDQARQQHSDCFHLAVYVAIV